MLLLRAAVGTTAIIQGGIYLADRANSTLANWFIGLFSIISGSLLLIGLLTPVAAIAVAFGALAVALVWVPPSMPGFLDSKLPTAFVIIMAMAIIFLGPGALSLDSRLFGRREIIIPSKPRSPQP